MDRPTTKFVKRSATSQEMFDLSLRILMYKAAYTIYTVVNVVHVWSTNYNDFYFTVTTVIENNDSLLLLKGWKDRYFIGIIRNASVREELHLLSSLDVYVTRLRSYKIIVYIV